jgi:hypothetical protein
VCDGQVSSLLSFQDWQGRNENARMKDTKALHDRLGKLESDHCLLRQMLGMSTWLTIYRCNGLQFSDSQHYSLHTMMLSLRRKLEQQSLGTRERQFFSHSIRYLSTMSGRQVRAENWMITSFEVEFGPEIGSGGLCVFSDRGAYLTFFLCVCVARACFQDHGIRRESL